MHRNGRRSAEMERVAEQAWSNLTSTVESGGDLAKAVGKRTRRMVDDAGHKVSTTSREARRRTDNALDALAGRSPRKPWGPMVAIAAVGVLVGWLSAVFGRQAMEQAKALSDRDELDTMLSDEVTPAP